MIGSLRSSWILQNFQNNGLPGLADELEIARLIGLMEMKQTYDSLHAARKHTVVI